MGLQTGKPAGGTQPPNRAVRDDAPRQPSRAAIVLWLTVAIMAILCLPLFWFSMTIRDETQRLQTELASAHAALTNVPTPPPEIKQLHDVLAQAQAQATQVSAIYPTIVAPRLDWLAVMAVVGNYASDQITITALTRADKTITLGGTAINQDAVIAYAHALEQSNLFSHVTIQSIQVLPTPAATPTTAPTPVPTPTWFPFPDGRDPYEPDDTNPKPIAPGQPQLHAFYPSFDVDSATVLVKAGRYYRVYTTELAPGVDTFLTVRIGDNVYINDDARPGTLASEVIFQNTGSDTDVLIVVTNRGQFGVDKTYKLVVSEIVPTPTPFPTPTPTSMPTATPTSTNTPTPTNTPTLTPTSTPTRTSTIPAGATPVSGRLTLHGLLRPIVPPLSDVDVRAAPDSMTVKFVIVLELKGVSP